MRPVLILWAASLLLAALANPAAGYWSTGGVGLSQAPVETLSPGNQPAATAAATTVTVQWPQTSFRGSFLGTYGGGGYTIRRYPAAGGAAIVPGGDCGGTPTGTSAALSCQEPGVPAGYWRYTVTPRLSTWTGAESVQSATVSVAPSAPVIESVTARGPGATATTGSIDVQWTAVGAATGYDVYRRTAGGTYDFSAPLNGLVPLTGTTYTDPGAGLSGGTTYVYTVRAIAGGVRSADSNERSATAVARPPAPASVSATAAAGGQITVGWPAVTGASGFNVYRRTSTGAFDFAAPLNGATPATGTSYSDTTAVNGTSYRYAVRSVGAGAGGSRLESFSSPESPAATADAIAPSGVALSDPGNPLKGAITLTATASDSSGIASVRVQYKLAGGGTWNDGCSAGAAPYSCTLTTNALPDDVYDLRVLAADPAGNATASASLTGRRIDNTAPSVTMGDPGAFIRGTVTLTATAADAGAGVATLRIQRAPTGSATWTDVCGGAAVPASCPLNTTTLAEGGYDLRAIATDGAGHVTTSALVSNRVIDNTAPVATDVQSANRAGGTAGRPETGDTLTYLFSEPVNPGSILNGWTGAATPVVVRFTNGNPDVITVFDAANATQLALGSVTSGKKYVTANTTFTGSSVVLAGNAVTVTFGTASGGVATANGAGGLVWTSSTAATDRAGNPVGAATVLETGVLDLDF
jgi:hypothetical protein